MFLKRIKIKNEKTNCRLFSKYHNIFLDTGYWILDPVSCNLYQEENQNSDKESIDEKGTVNHCDGWAFLFLIVRRRDRKIIFI